MKQYYTLKYDFAAPTSKAVNAPLDSGYGVAVKTYVNGVETAGSVSIDGNSPAEGPDGWKLFDLSSGSSPCIKNYGISAVARKAEHVGFVETAELKNTQPFPMSLNAKFYLSSYFAFGGNDAVVESEDVALFKGYGAGQEVPVTDMKLFAPSGGVLSGYCLSAGEWTNPQNGERTPSLYIDENSYVQVSYQVPAS